MTTASVKPGDTLEYTINVANSAAAGTDTAAGVILRDPIPAGLTYAPGTIQIVSNPRTDASGDDTAEFDAGNNRVVARLGTGAGTSAGGSLAPGAASTVRFRATVDGSINAASAPAMPMIAVTSRPTTRSRLSQRAAGWVVPSSSRRMTPIRAGRPCRTCGAAL